jgi:putative Mg2+ transporter-C (MgtC) family protein
VGFLLSGIIGMEREHRQQIAGLRTHILICLGSVLFTLMARSIAQTFPGSDASRIPSTIVSGIGFIAAGAIIKLGFTVKGVTTIASIWSMGALGLAVGMGRYDIAMIATVFIFLSLTVIGWLSKKVFSKKNYHKIRVIAKYSKELYHSISEVLFSNEVRIRNMSLDEDDKTIELEYLVEIDDELNIHALAETLRSIKCVERVEIE